MSTVIATSVLPDSTANDTLTIGATGDSVVVTGNDLRTNVLQDAGGNTTFVSDGAGAITSTGLPGAMKFISSQTGSSSSGIAFTTQLTSTYDVYCFKFVDINPVTDGTELTFQVSTDGGSTYGMTITSTWFRAYHMEADNGAALGYVAAGAQAQGTAYQRLIDVIGSAADENASGELYLFAPVSTTYVKQFYGKFNCTGSSAQTQNAFVGGYVNDTSAIDAINFKMSSGNFDGTIALYGISKT